MYGKTCRLYMWLYVAKLTLSQISHSSRYCVLPPQLPCSACPFSAFLFSLALCRLLPTSASVNNSHFGILKLAHLHIVTRVLSQTVLAPSATIRDSPSTSIRRIRDMCLIHLQMITLLLLTWTIFRTTRTTQVIGYQLAQIPWAKLDTVGLQWKTLRTMTTS